MTEIRDTTRSKQLERGQVLDEAARNRRHRKALEALERDNFQEAPTLPTTTDYRQQLNKKLQQRFNVDDNTNNSGSSATSNLKRKFKTESKVRFRKNFNTLIEEEQSMIGDKRINYFSVCVPASKFPARKFCSVCGFPSNYSCVQCGTKYCSSKCLQTHKDTRCLKWTA